MSPGVLSCYPGVISARPIRSRFAVRGPAERRAGFFAPAPTPARFVDGPASRFDPEFLYHDSIVPCALSAI